MKLSVISTAARRGRKYRSVACAKAGCARTLVSAALTLSILGIYKPADAQASNASPGLHGTAVRNKHLQIDAQVDKLAKVLELNEQQRSAIRNILEQRQQEILEMRHAPSPAGGSPTDRFRAIEDLTADRIRAVLSEEQRKKYDPIGQRRLPSTAQQANVEDWMNASRPKNAK